VQDLEATITLYRDGVETVCRVNAGSRGDRIIDIQLTSSTGQQWRARGGDAFTALMEVRAQVEHDGYLVGCNGARRNAWASGMQRDMGEGLVCYLLTLGEHESRPPTVHTLDPAPVEELSTVADQRTFYDAWLAERP
jgi:hypothetical protein